VYAGLNTASTQQDDPSICTNGIGLEPAKKLSSKIVRVGTGGNSAFFVTVMTLLPDGRGVVETL
jgi:hypothetical protein